MEATAAIGLVSNIIQLSEFASKVVSNAREIQNSGSGLPKEAKRVRQLAATIQPRLECALQATTGTDLESQEFRAYLKDLQDGVTAFLAELDSIQARSTDWRERYKKASKSRQKKEYLQQSLKKIEEASSQTSLRLITLYLPRMDSKLDNLETQLSTKIDDTSTQLSMKLDDTSIQLTTKLQELKTIVQQTQSSNTGTLLKTIEKWIQDEIALKAQRKAQRERLDIQRKYLQALYFPKLGSREKEVHDAHEKTFRWILGDWDASEDDFDSPENDSHSSEGRRNSLEDEKHSLEEEPEEDGDGGHWFSQREHVHRKSKQFQHWLQSEDPTLSNVFWITGKPGSGKSTLVRLLAHHAALRDFLDAWQKDKRLILIHHYFGKEGSKVQRSLIGLLRSILYQILEQCPALVNVAFENETWLNGGQEFDFSNEALHGALKKILASAPALGLKIFLLIDGLDEFDDQDEYVSDFSNERDLIEFLRVFHYKPSVKLCVASRPHNIFRQEFGQEQGLHLCLHELTHDDIEAYIRETMENERIFQQLRSRDNGYNDLVAEIIDAAQGVFLWVRIVVRRLLDGMTDAERFSDLRRELRQLPRELESLYKYELDSLDPEKKRRAARVLLALVTVSDIPIMDRRFSRWIPVSPLSAAFIYVDPSEHSGIIKREDQTVENLQRLQEDFRIPIFACCRGLVDTDRKVYTSPIEHNFWGESLTFSHRTIGDFLRNQRMQSFLAETASLSKADIYFRLCKGILAVLRVIDVGSALPIYERDKARMAVKSISTLTILLDRSGYGDLSYELRLDFELICKDAQSRYNIIKCELEYHQSTRSGIIDCYFVGNILELATTLGWGARYLRRRLSQASEVLKAQDCTSALLCYVELGIFWQMPDILETQEILSVLFEYGADLNFPVGDTVYWEIFLEGIWTTWHDPQWRVLGLVKMLEICLKHGSYPRVDCKMVVYHTDYHVGIRSAHTPEPIEIKISGVFNLSFDSIVQTILQYFPLEESGIDKSLLSSSAVLADAGFIGAKAIEEVCNLAAAEGWKGAPKDLIHGSILICLACGSRDLSSYIEEWRTEWYQKDLTELNALACNSEELRSYWQWRAQLSDPMCGDELEQEDKDELDALASTECLASYRRWKADRRGKILYSIEKVTYEPSKIASEENKGPAAET